jgi:hypothetical protein
VLVKKIDAVARARELFTAHCAGRSAADDRYLGHSPISLSAFNPAPGRGTSVMCLFDDGSFGDWLSGEGKDHQAKARLKYSTE